MNEATGNRQQGTDASVAASTARHGDSVTTSHQSPVTSHQGTGGTGPSTPLRCAQDDKNGTVSAVGGGVPDAPRADPKKRPERKKAEPGRGFAVKYIYPILWWILRICLPLYHWPSFRGRENLPEGPCVICANHSGFADPLWVFLLMKTRMPPWTMARKSLFEKPVFGRFLAAFRAFPVDRDNADMAAVKKSLSVLKQGEKLLIFPEGTRVKKGKKSEPKSGAVLLAQRAGAPLVPVYITHGRKPFQPIRVVMGPAYTPAYSSRRPDAAELERHTAELMEKIYRLGNPEI